MMGCKMNKPNFIDDEPQPEPQPEAKKRGRKPKAEKKQAEEVVAGEPGEEVLFRVKSDIYSEDEIKRIQAFAESIKVPKKTALIAQKHIAKNKAAKKWYCECCDYNAPNKSAYVLHTYSKRHAAKQFDKNSTLVRPS